MFLVLKLKRSTHIGTGMTCIEGTEYLTTLSDYGTRMPRATSEIIWLLPGCEDTFLTCGFRIAGYSVGVFEKLGIPARTQRYSFDTVDGVRPLHVVEHTAPPNR